MVKALDKVRSFIEDTGELPVWVHEEFLKLDQ